MATMGLYPLLRHPAPGHEADEAIKKCGGKMKTLFFIIILLTISACTPSRQAIMGRVDPVSVSSQSKLETDADECMTYAQIEADNCKLAAGINTGAGAIIGAGVGILVGAVIGHDTRSVATGIGAIAGAIRGAGATQCKTNVIVGNCLLNRGYRLLW
jgi:outer membrane lipoprotein SlyB